jgi:hypothetical protein
MSIIAIAATSDIRIAVTKIDNNTSLNNYTTVIKSTRRKTIDSTYNRESNIGSI